MQKEIYALHSPRFRALMILR